MLLLFFVFSEARSQSAADQEKTTSEDQSANSIQEDVEASVSQIELDWAIYVTHPWVLVDSSDQRLYLVSNGKVERSWPVSTAKNGMGNDAESGKTPVGAHRIFAKIGEGVPLGYIFTGQVYSGKKALIQTDPEAPDGDLITSRILWLAGLETGINKGGTCDSKNRMIYIHGTDAEGKIGTPASHGCIRMKNVDIIALFRIIGTGCFVYIQR